MGLFSGVKGKLGFGNAPEWQDEGPYDEYAADEGYDGGSYDDGSYDDGYSSGGGDVISFDAYDPNNFEHISIQSDREIRVASYDDDDYAPSYVSRSSSRGGGYDDRSSRRASNVRPLHDRGPVDAGPTWATPSDPAFLDAKGPSYSGNPLDDLDSRSGDSYAQAFSDISSIGRDPATHLEIVQPTRYADVERIASAAKAGKTVILSLASAKSELAKRILDFSFGVASALNGNVDKAADRVFVISRSSAELNDSEISYLQKKGIL